MQLDPLIRFYQELSLDTVARLPSLYAPDAWFKDPFNEVRGTEAIQRIFTHMFAQVASPRFIVTEKLRDAGGAMLVWEFHFRSRGSWGGTQAQVIRGVSHLKFNAEGLVTYHRDYWDAAEELYAKLPLLGAVMRRLRKALSASG